ncbi:hypothetical protein L596_002357 [Steinernema carpocapsae]|uniref:C2 domain-containing protein n=1 Tax=Steinernema carpocapsae TaxID=34508 RepID=A0A4U8USY6_STECR|nr:hypothetical protein L596_002357 [Steinernema carpocapsae]
MMHQMRRLSCIPQALNQKLDIIATEFVNEFSDECLNQFSHTFIHKMGLREARLEVTAAVSQQEMAESALQFLERRRSTEHSMGSIQPDLYRRRGSVVNHQSAKGLPSVGRAQLQMTYDFTRSDFLVTLLNVCCNTNLDEYFITLILGDTKRRESSKIVSGAQFHQESFKFPVSYDELLEKSLTIQLVGARRIGTCASVIGSVSIDLSSIDPTDDLLLWTDIDAFNAAEKRGEVLLGLHHLQSAERLTVTVNQARELVKNDGFPNAYVKIALVQGEKVVKKRKTAVKKSSANPVWNEAINFSVSAKNLSNSQLRVCVVDYDRFGTQKILGEVTLGTENRIWQDMLEGRNANPRWVELRPSL